MANHKEALLYTYNYYLHAVLYQVSKVTSAEHD